MIDVEVAVVGAGAVGSATALALARRGVAVALLEAEAEPGLAASGTNSGILHTGFDSAPGELETELILRAAAIRDELLDGLDVPVRRCGGLLRDAPAGLADNARRNGVEVRLRDDGGIEVPGEAVTDPVRYTLALAAAAARHGTALVTGFRASSLEWRGAGFHVASAGGDAARCRVVVNCAGLHADDVARLAGDASFEIYPRKGEFLVFEPPSGQGLDRILLPVPTKRTKGMLVFPTVDGQVVAGPTAIDQEDKGDWSVRPRARDEILRSVTPLWPAIEGAEPLAAYAGLRPAGRGVNYLIGPSAARPELVNVAAIRSTGLTASPAIAERVCSIVAKLGVGVGPQSPLGRGSPPAALELPWWRRTAEYRVR